MKGIVTIVAASAVLSASLCAGLAAGGDIAGPNLRTQTAVQMTTRAPTPPAAWTDPPAKRDTKCLDAAWPYRITLCAKAGPNETPAPQGASHYDGSSRVRVALSEEGDVALL